MYDTVINETNNALSTIPGVPATFIRENVTGQADLRSDWMRTTLIPSEPLQLSRGDRILKQYSGLMQIDYFKAKGTSSNSLTIDAIVNHFNGYNGRFLGDDSFLQLTVLRAWRGTSTQEDTWYRTPVMLRLQWYQE